MVLAAVAAPAFAASAVCSSEFEDYSAGYAWRGTILADDGKLYDFEVASFNQASTIAAIAAGAGGARGAYNMLILIGIERGTVTTPSQLATITAHATTADAADVTVMPGEGTGTWSILCFPTAGSEVSGDPVLVERRGGSLAVNPAADELRALLQGLDPVFDIAAQAAAGATPRTN